MAPMHLSRELDGESAPHWRAWTRLVLLAASGATHIILPFHRSGHRPRAGRGLADGEGPSADLEPGLAESCPHSVQRTSAAPKSP